MSELLSQAKGNAAFSAGKFEEAIELFTQAIEVNSENHVLYSNRSAARVRCTGSYMSHSFLGKLEGI